MTNCFDHGTTFSEFFAELTEDFVSADIPLWKLQNEHLGSFLEKYTKQPIPQEWTLRKNYSTLVKLVENLWPTTKMGLKSENENAFIYLMVRAIIFL